jgi:4-aminobutyrate aminotransferase-like enzyme
VEAASGAMLWSSSAGRSTVDRLVVEDYPDRNGLDAALTEALVTDCAARGLVILPCGTRGNVVRFLVRSPPRTL